MQVSASAQDFMQQLPKFDQEFGKKQEDAENAGEVSNSLRIYVEVSKRIVALTASSCMKLSDFRV